jgi:hypothetical protein
MGRRMFARHPFDKTGLREYAHGDPDCCGGEYCAADSREDQEAEGRPEEHFPHGCHSLFRRNRVALLFPATAAERGAAAVDAITWNPLS